MENFKIRYLTALASNPEDGDLRLEFMVALCQHLDWVELKKQAEAFILQNPARAFGYLAFTRTTTELLGMEKATFSFANAKACIDFAEATAHYPAMLPQSIRDQLQVLLARTDSPDARSKPSRQVHFSDIIGMEDLKKKIRLRVVDPYLRPELFEKFGKAAGGGILLYGPPGCGKTMLARAVATEVKAEFISVEVSEILGAYTGESEKNLAAIFNRARASRPCVLMFDELDALAFSRSKTVSDHARSLVNEFLNQLDGIEKDNKDILFMAATNMPWDVDSAMKRPGRFDRLLFIPPPDAAAREAMFKTKLEKVPCDPLDLKKLAELTPRASGADIDGVIDSAKEILIEEILETGNERNLSQSDFTRALKTFSPSTNDWLKTAHNLVRFGNSDKAYQDLDEYFQREKL